MTKDEIRTAGRLAHDAYYEKGYDAGRKIADDLIGRMVLDGSNTPTQPVFISVTYGWL